MLKELENSMREVEKMSNYNGYFYNIGDILVITVMALLSGLQDINGIYQWTTVQHVREFFTKHFGIENFPKRSHFYNILSYVNHEAFSCAFDAWIRKILKNKLDGETITIDGKSIRSTGKLTKDNSMLHIASAMIASSGMIIASKECTYAKSSEVEVFREIVKNLELSGAIVTADALHCKPKSAEAVIEAGADYLFVVKDNNKKLKENIELLSYNKNTDKFSQTEESGGRIETRTAYVSNCIENLPDKEKWKNLACVGAIHKTVEKKSNPGEKSEEWHFYICSKDLSAQELLHHARQEWSIESMHWLLDVHFAEDKTRVQDMQVQKTLNLLRKITLNLVKDFQASLPKHMAVSAILRQNMFDLNHLAKFITYFK